MRLPRGNSSVGRARPCQGRGREFESRFPLQIADKTSDYRGFVFYGVRRARQDDAQFTASRMVRKSKSPSAWWQSGHVAACKAAYAGSIPTQASNITNAASAAAVLRVNIRHSTRAARSARVAKLVDARDLKSLTLAGMPVRVRPRAPTTSIISLVSPGAARRSLAQLTLTVEALRLFGNGHGVRVAVGAPVGRRAYRNPSSVHPAMACCSVRLASGKASISPAKRSACSPSIITIRGARPSGPRREPGRAARSGQQSVHRMTNPERGDRAMPGA